VCIDGSPYCGRVDNGYVCVIKNVEFCDSENDVIQGSRRIYLCPGVIKIWNCVR